MPTKVCDHCLHIRRKRNVSTAGNDKRAGHGSDNNNCAEFCPTAHMFAVNGAEHTLNFTVAGTGFGCTAQVRAVFSSKDSTATVAAFPCLASACCAADALPHSMACAFQS